MVATQKVNIVQQTMRTINPSEFGFGYKVTKRIKIPNLPSGVYLWDNTVPMIIRAKEPKIVVVYPSNTANAYSNSGGKSLYNFNSSDQIQRKESIVPKAHPIAMALRSISSLAAPGKFRTSDTSPTWILKTSTR